MALKAPYMVKTVEGNTDLQLEADTGESFKVIDIQIANPASSYIEVVVDKATVGYFRVGGTLGSHLSFAPSDSEKKTVLGLLREKGIFRGIPVAEGQKLTIKNAAAANAVQKVVYEVYDAGDITPDMPNGTEAREYDFIMYGRPSAVADGSNLVDTQLNPVEFTNFPFAGDVPAKTRMEVYGVLFSDVGKTSGTGANKHITKYLKLIKGRTVLFDEDRNGIPAIGVAPASDGTNIGTGYSEIGNYSDVDRRLPLIFDEPLKFEAGEELNVYVVTDVIAGSANLASTDVEVGLIMRQISMG